jgi:hypothetical protein
MSPSGEMSVTTVKPAAPGASIVSTVSPLRTYPWATISGVS